jgi:hypothetical protein
MTKLEKLYSIIDNSREVGVRRDGINDSPYLSRIWKCSSNNLY